MLQFYKTPKKINCYFKKLGGGMKVKISQKKKIILGRYGSDHISKT